MHLNRLARQTSASFSAHTMLMHGLHCSSSLGGRTAPAMAVRPPTSLARYSSLARLVRPCEHRRSTAACRQQAARVHVTCNAASVETVEPATATSRTIKQFTKKMRVADLKDAGASVAGQVMEVRGWVRSVRNQKTFSFVEVNDGSSMQSLQVVVEPTAQGYELLTDGAVNTGASVVVSGELAQSPGGKQAVELRASSLALVGGSDVSTYPLQKKRHSLEFLRSIAHLRPRTNTISAVARVRSALAYATHQFFQTNGFVYVHTPILSASDCEGAGEMFQVTTLINEYDRAVREGVPTAEQLQSLQAAVSQAGGRLADLKQAAKADEALKPKVAEAVQELLQAKEQLGEAEGRVAAARGLPLKPEGGVDYKTDFFGRPTYLTVSGQLNGEMYACAMGDIYTFGPTFRAENSNTSRHLAEFWMIEPEMAFADLEDDMACAQAYLKHCVAHVLTHCQSDLGFFEKQYEAGLIKRLQDVLEKPFATVTYSEAVRILQSSGKSFEYPVSWGADLQSEHERYLTEVVFAKTPLIVTDYPKEFKAFYMRLNDDEKTVAAMDLLVPNVGELMGGSQREERLDVLTARMQAAGLSPDDYWWYLDLRRYGSQPHAGFGLGFERLVQFATGVENIRDVIPFPRYPGHCEF